MPQVYFFYPVFHWGNIVGKILPKTEVLEKPYLKMGDGHNRGELSKKGGLKTSADYDIERLKGGTLDS